MSAYIALIRTHHITSRRKIAALRLAAQRHGCFALLCSGGSPGMMFVEGPEDAVKTWVSKARDLRYKDYHLAARPSESKSDFISESSTARLDEVNSIKDFAIEMERKNVLTWWRIAMSYKSD